LAGLTSNNAFAEPIHVSINQYFLANAVGDEEMDLLWADGWRHFGNIFFRYSTAEHDSGLCHVLPLRVALENFIPSRSQRRVLKRNRELRVVVRNTFIDAAKEALFDRHRKRFKQDPPDSLYDIFSMQPASVPCRNQEICLLRGDELIAASFLDIGKIATSAVYTAFEPAEHKRSLGIFSMLKAIDYSRAIGARYYYPGYAYREPSVYDYKKNFAGMEFLDWDTNWKPFNGHP
jgi:arginyl-tRNA--protein-N-Asp/Glu arginylyltransferase